MCNDSSIEIVDSFRFRVSFFQFPKMLLLITLYLLTVDTATSNDTYKFIGCYAHRTGDRIETWDTTGLTLNSCASLASSSRLRFFVLEFPEGYSSTFHSRGDPVASCGMGGDFTLDGQIDSAYCLFRVRVFSLSISLLNNQKRRRRTSEKKNRDSTWEVQEPWQRTKFSQTTKRNKI